MERTLERTTSHTAKPIQNRHMHRPEAASAAVPGGRIEERQKNDVVTVDGMRVGIGEERNLLELIRSIGIDIPTFCYHSELSVYGACRLCMVEVEGRGIVASCSTVPEPGMVVRTNTARIREIRTVNLQLLLANHHIECVTCGKNDSCKLRSLAARFGIDCIPFGAPRGKRPLDDSSDALIRDPNKCILCGDCVRYCSEIQGIGAIDFTYRGAEALVAPAFGRQLSGTECVNCGGCATVCPTGAITPKSETANVWAALSDPGKTVVAQIAPAVRVAIGEMFLSEPGAGTQAGARPGGIATMGKIAAALKRIGFDYVFDTTFAADLTVVEEAGELLDRMATGEKLPLFTSCCPAWVKYAEQFFPELLDNLSTCKSPQQMFGAVAKRVLSETLHVAPSGLTVVSIMPCTAKKFEARRPELRYQPGQHGTAAPGTGSDIPEVDHVLTTQELGRMIRESGLRFSELEPASMDQPFGSASGAGLIFGTSGGVTEAVLRFAYEKVSGKILRDVDFHAVRGDEKIRSCEVEIDGTVIRAAMAHGLRAAAELAAQARAGESPYHVIEVMACPGGCVGGAGQPIPAGPETRCVRGKALYAAEKLHPMQKSQDNPLLSRLYREYLGEPGGPEAHRLLHTGYRRRAPLYSDQPPCPGISP